MIDPKRRKILRKGVLSNDDLKNQAYTAQPPKLDESEE